MPAVYHKAGGVWTKINAIYYKIAGSWTTIKSVYYKVAGAWVKVFSTATAPVFTAQPYWTGTANTASIATYYIGTITGYTNTVTYIYSSGGSTIINGGTSASYNISLSSYGGQYLYGYTVAYNGSLTTTSSTVLFPSSGVIASVSAPSSSNTFGSCSSTGLAVGDSVYAGVSSSASPYPSFTYQLQYSFNNVSFTNQAGGSSGFYTLTSSDVPNQYFRYYIVATNAYGSYGFYTNSVGPTVGSTIPNTPSSASSTFLGSSGSNFQYSISWTASQSISGIIYYAQAYSYASGGQTTGGTYRSFLSLGSTSPATVLVPQTYIYWGFAVEAYNPASGQYSPGFAPSSGTTPSS
jgi:hypothetical protein